MPQKCSKKDTIMYICYLVELRLLGNKFNKDYKERRFHNLRKSNNKKSLRRKDWNEV